VKCVGVTLVCLTNSSGNTVEVYEYDVYGRVGASDANHPNRFMFTGREFDKETGLYYYRARYYNPQIGRFLQTDPVGYGAGMNLYRYCGNSPVGHVDPSGLITVAFYDGGDRDNGNSFREGADDRPAFTFSYDMRNGEPNMTCAEYIIFVLGNLHKNNVEVTDVYIFDHGMSNLNDPNSHGLQIGDEIFWQGSVELKKFSEDLASVTGTDDPDTPEYDGTTLNFRNCYAGNLVEDIAEWSKRKATGYTDVVIPWVANFPEPDEKERPGPDYYGTGKYVEATPGQEAKRSTPDPTMY
jgi:RHS repeat-associated protein